ncbi:hypothetical protein FOA52_015101 [Chlamydomonas sp. UWO 241]|nr:hypothetical protein FOA52_015101 [Chlamydomonas sp. UWO 241]
MAHGWQRRVVAIPLPVAIAILCLNVLLLGGNVLHMNELPSPGPGGPQVTATAPSHGSSGRRALLLDGAASAQVASRQPDLLGEAFEKNALSGSGFDVLRPALPPSASGDAAMHAIPFQTISWYPRITYYPGEGLMDSSACHFFPGAALPDPRCP